MPLKEENDKKKNVSLDMPVRRVIRMYRGTWCVGLVSGILICLLAKKNVVDAGFILCYAALLLQLMLLLALRYSKTLPAFAQVFDGHPKRLFRCFMSTMFAMLYLLVYTMIWQQRVKPSLKVTCALMLAAAIYALLVVVDDSITYGEIVCLWMILFWIVDLILFSGLSGILACWGVCYDKSKKRCRAGSRESYFGKNLSLLWRQADCA